MGSTSFSDQLHDLCPAAVPPGRFPLDGSGPCIAIAPQDRSETAGALKLASEAQAVVVPWGGGFRQGMGFLPTRYDVVLSTENLTRLVDLQPGDLTVTVEAGMTLRALQDLLSVHGQFVALESPAPQLETIGGILATASSGILRFAHGTPRDQVIGIAVAMPDGNVVHGGGRVVKNVAGYDLCKLFTGSFGTLGVIVEATLRVRPRPASERAWISFFPSAAALEEAIAAIIDSPVQPAFIQALDPGALAGAPFNRSGEGHTTEWALAVGADGHPSLSQWIVHQVDHLTSAARSQTSEGEESSGVRRWLVEQCAPKAPLAVKVSVRSSEVCAWMDACRTTFNPQNQFQVSSNAAAGNGIVYMNFLPAPGTPTGEIVGLVERLAREADERAGTLSVLAAPADVRSLLPMWGLPLQTTKLSRAIREKLDPGKCLNRGRLFSGEGP